MLTLRSITRSNKTVLEVKVTCEGLSMIFYRGKQRVEWSPSCKARKSIYNLYSAIVKESTSIKIHVSDRKHHGHHWIKIKRSRSNENVFTLYFLAKRVRRSVMPITLTVSQLEEMALMLYQYYNLAEIKQAEEALPAASTFTSFTVNLHS